MQWIWQLPDWPEFKWDRSLIVPLEAQFQHESGRRIGAWRHLSDDDRSDLRIDWLSDEAVETSAIEGEILDRDSIQSSIRRQFGWSVDRHSTAPAETGVANMMVALYRSFDKPLDHDSLWNWHLMLMNWRIDLTNIGCYRQQTAAMQIVSKHDYRKVHYEAPPSTCMMTEMNNFVDWYNQTLAEQDKLSTLTRAGIAHLYFVCIHPFEDGNGRIARALAEKSIAQSIGQPSLIALSRQIFQHRKEYYSVLKTTNSSLDITRWLVWFSKTIIDAQIWSERRLIRTIEQAQLFNRLEGQLNSRQKLAILRLFKAEPDGFKGGLSAKNYFRITGAAPSTVTRDLSDLVAKGVLRRTGERRSTRYWLNVSSFPEIDES